MLCCNIQLNIPLSFCFGGDYYEPIFVFCRKMNSIKSEAYMMQKFIYHLYLMSSANSNCINNIMIMVKIVQYSKRIHLSFNVTNFCHRDVNAVKLLQFVRYSFTF